MLYFESGNLQNVVRLSKQIIIISYIKIPGMKNNQNENSEVLSNLQILSQQLGNVATNKEFRMPS
jgi:hypothetical protein